MSCYALALRQHTTPSADPKQSYLLVAFPDQAYFGIRTPKLRLRRTRMQIQSLPINMALEGEDTDFEVDIFSVSCKLSSHNP